MDRLIDNEIIKENIHLLKNQIFDKIKQGKNSLIYYFKYKSDRFIKLNIDVFHNKKSIKRNQNTGYIDCNKLLENDLKETDLWVSQQSEKINPHELICTLHHEIKHVHDVILYKEKSDTINCSMINYDLKKFFKNTPYYDFIFNVYLNFECEYECRTSSIYSYLRWKKYKNIDEMSQSFKKSYMFNSLCVLHNFDHKRFISEFDNDSLKEHTDIFINEYSKYDKNIMKVDKNVPEFYKYWENEFFKNSYKYLKKSNDVIDEVYDEIISDRVNKSNF